MCWSWTISRRFAAARAVIDRVPEFSLVGESDSGESAVMLAEQLHPDLVLMDINMGAMDGLEATRLITGARPGTIVILVSTYAESDLPPGARSSAAAYVNKDDSARSCCAACGKPAATPPGA